MIGESAKGERIYYGDDRCKHCFHCWGVGHWSTNCPNERDEFVFHFNHFNIILSLTKTNSSTNVMQSIEIIVYKIIEVLPGGRFR